MDSYLLNHSAHDYRALMERWRTLADTLDLEVTTFVEKGDHSVFLIQNERAADSEEGGIYLSAGVHGDECAPVSALLEWGESDPSVFGEVPLTIFPCMNPFGLVENIRRDVEGFDLNRNFQNREHPLICKWQDFLKGKRFSVAVNLHEDYDSHGIYIYEIGGKIKPAERLLTACQDIIPRDMNAEVDGTAFNNGIASRSEDLQELVEKELEGGYPEAIYLALHHTDCALTFETPSEFGLTERVKAHRRFLEELIAIQQG